MSKTLKNKAGLGKVGIIVAVVVVVVAALAAFLVLRGAGKETIKLGAVLSITGPGSDAGLGVRDGMLLAIDEINSRGGVQGRQIELILEDSQSNPQEAEGAFDRIEKEHHPLLFVSNSSSVSVPLASLSEDSEVVLVGLVTASPEVTAGKEWAFRYYPTAEQEVPPMLSLLAQLKVKELGILYLNDQYGLSTAEPLREGFEKAGGTVKSVPFEVTSSDFGAEINQLRDMEAICTIGYVRHVGDILGQLKEENYDGFLLASMAATAYNVTRDPSVTDGVHVAAPIIYDRDFLLAKEVKEKYESKYGSPFTHQVANGYDFIRLLAGLLEDEEISRENVKNVLEAGFVHPGIFGTIDVKPGEHDIVFPLHPAQFVDGELEYWR